MNPSLQLVVFDMAGTTVADHDEVHRALQQALATEDVAVSYDEANAVMGYPKPVAIRQLLKDKLTDMSRVTDQYVEQIHRNFVEHMVQHYRESPEVTEKEGVQNTLAGTAEAGNKDCVGHRVQPSHC